uniref:DNA (cytosine-5-)-methyltransferase n=1 Tax=Ascaris lumbricoides TaxID=6252 RepID=A0A0M3I213_ASCLU
MFCDHGTAVSLNGRPLHSTVLNAETLAIIEAFSVDAAQAAPAPARAASAPARAASAPARASAPATDECLRLSLKGAKRRYPNQYRCIVSRRGTHAFSE